MSETHSTCGVEDCDRPLFDPEFAQRDPEYLHRCALHEIASHNAEELRGWGEENAEGMVEIARKQLDVEQGLPAPDEHVITVYRRMEAAAAGARVERDIMRTAIEGIAAGDEDPVGIARAALATDLARREANLAALGQQREPGGRDS